jgi:hypothetical protein
MTDAQIDTVRLTASASDPGGLAALPRAESFNGPLGPYTLQGSIGACFASIRHRHRDGSLQGHDG